MKTIFQEEDDHPRHMMTIIATYAGPGVLRPWILCPGKMLLPGFHHQHHRRHHHHRHHHHLFPPHQGWLDWGQLRREK